MSADEYRGCETDSVIYVGGGNIEAFSRAKVWLGIITFYGNIEKTLVEKRYDKYDTTDSKHFTFHAGLSVFPVNDIHRTQNYDIYRKGLIEATKLGLVHKLDLSDEPGFLYGPGLADIEGDGELLMSGSGGKHGLFGRGKMEGHPPTTQDFITIREAFEKEPFHC